MSAQPTPAKVPYRYLSPTGEDTEDQLPYILLREVAQNYIQDLVDLNVHFTYHQSLKPNRDGREQLGMTRMNPDPGRQQTGIDVNLILNYTWWTHPTTTRQQKLALIHHLCCRIGITRGDDQLPVKDELGRCRLYARKPDIEEFRDVIQAHGLYVDDLQRAYRAMQDSENVGEAEAAAAEETQP